MLAPFYAIRRIIWTAGLVMHYITIPGSFCHELAHQLACYLVGHRVLEVRYIVRDDPTFAGYVRHQGPPGAARHLFIGIAPLLMGAAIWTGALALGWHFLRDGHIALWQAGLLLPVAWITANATYHALPSPQDMENVFRQPFGVFTLPCWLVAAPVWLLAQNYRFHLWGWTLWRALVVIGTGYVIYLLASPDWSVPASTAGILDRMPSAGAPGELPARIIAAAQTVASLLSGLASGLVSGLAAFARSLAGLWGM